MTIREMPRLLYPWPNRPVRFFRPAGLFASCSQKGRILSELYRWTCSSGIVLVFPYRWHPPRYSQKFIGEPARCYL